MLRHQRNRPRLAAVLAFLAAMAIVLTACQSNDLDADTEPPVSAESPSEAVDTEADSDSDTFQDMPSSRTENGSFVDVLASAHQYFGYLVALIVLGFSIVGLADRRETAFDTKLFVVPAVFIDVQVLAGLLMYTLGRYWEHPSWLVRLLHPLLALAALAVSHVMVGRARRNDAPLAARRTAASGLLIALVLIAGAIAAVSAGLRGAG